MFRLNLYHEAEAKRRARLSRLGSTAAATALTGIIVGLTLFHAVSGFLIAERTGSYERLLEQRKAELAGVRAPGQAAQLKDLQRRLKEKTERAEWSVKLAELARLIPDSLVLEQVELSRRAKGRSEPSLIVNGNVLPGRGRDPIREVVSYVDRLRDSPAFASGLRAIDVASVVSDDVTGVTLFRIVCPIGDGDGS